MAPGTHGGSRAPAVECRSLEVRYGEQVAVDRLSFRVAPGEVLAILGPNGAGKTSTVETLEGYRRPSAGQVRVLGLDPHKDHRALVKRMGVMLQRGGIYPTMTARQVVSALRTLLRRSRGSGRAHRTSRSRAGRADRLEAPVRRRAAASLARARTGRPARRRRSWTSRPPGSIPRAARDQAGGRSQLAGRGAGVVLTTHELAEAERAADRLIILADGRSIAEGHSRTARRARRRPRNPLRGTRGYRLRVARRRARDRGRHV